MTTTRDEAARKAVLQLCTMLEQIIQLSHNHLQLVALKPGLDAIKRSMQDDGLDIARAHHASSVPMLTASPPPPEPIPNGAPFHGCKACGRTVEELIGQGHASDCDAMRNPTIINV